MFAKHYHIFTYLLDVIQYQALMEKVNVPFLILGQKVKRKSDLTKTFIKLGNTPKLINSDDKNTLEFLAKTVYFGNVKDIENINLNEMKQHQFTSNGLKKITPSSDALNMHSLRAAHTAGFEWVECLHNVSVPDPSVRELVLKDDMFVPKWLSEVSTFNVAEFLRICKCKTTKCVACKCAKLGISSLVSQAW